MSVLHLSAGSEKPAPVDGKARLYSMKFCPYSQRVRLALGVKKVPHEIVNINLKSKPEWFLELNPSGKVPTFVDVDGKVVDDSLAILNYLDERYPESPLYKEETKARDLELIERYKAVTDLYDTCVHKKIDKPFEEILEQFLNYFKEYDEELGKRGTPLFGGNEIGILDIVTWPWVEQSKLLSLIHEKPLTYDKTAYPNFTKWVENIRVLQVVQDNYTSYHDVAKYVKPQLNGEEVDIDSI